jgi:hypothetical protein
MQILRFAAPDYYSAGKEHHRPLAGLFCWLWQPHVQQPLLLHHHLLRLSVSFHCSSTPYRFGRHRLYLGVENWCCRLYIHLVSKIAPPLKQQPVRHFDLTKIEERRQEVHLVGDLQEPSLDTRMAQL